MIITGNAYLVLEFACVMNSKVLEVLRHIIKSIHSDIQVATSNGTFEVATGDGTLVKTISTCLTNAVLDILFGKDEYGTVHPEGTVFGKYNVKIRDFHFVFEEMQVRMSVYFTRKVFKDPILMARPNIQDWRSFVESHPVSMPDNELIEFIDPGTGQNGPDVVFEQNGIIRGDSLKVLELGIRMHEKAKVIVNNLVNSDLNTRNIMTNTWLHQAVVDLDGHIGRWSTVFELLKTAVHNYILLLPEYTNNNLLRVLNQCNADPDLWSDMIRRHIQNASKG